MRSKSTVPHSLSRHYLMPITTISKHLFFFFHSTSVLFSFCNVHCLYLGALVVARHCVPLVWWDSKGGTTLHSRDGRGPRVVVGDCRRARTPLTSHQKFSTTTERAARANRGPLCKTSQRRRSRSRCVHPRLLFEVLPLAEMKKKKKKTVRKFV